MDKIGWSITMPIKIRNSLFHLFDCHDDFPWLFDTPVRGAKHVANLLILRPRPGWLFLGWGYEIWPLKIWLASNILVSWCLMMFCDWCFAMFYDVLWCLISDWHESKNGASGNGGGFRPALVVTDVTVQFYAVHFRFQVKFWECVWPLFKPMVTCLNISCVRAVSPVGRIPASIFAASNGADFTLHP